MSVFFCLPHSVAVIAFIICRGLHACTEILRMCVLYTFGCHAIVSAVLFILRSSLLLYSAGYGVNRVQVVLSGFNVRLLCIVHAKYLCRYGCICFLVVCVDVMVMSSAYAMT